METNTHTQSPATKTAWSVDPTHTVIGFTAKHLLITTVRGRFTRYEAAVVFDPKSPETAQMEVKIETASVDTGESKRDDHLRSADFFDAEHFPYLTFRSKKLQRVNDEQWKMTGDLTIRGTAREIVLDMEGFTEQIKDPWGNYRIGGTAAATLNRFDYGLHFDAALETGGLVVSDKIKIQLDVELMRKAD